MINEFRRAKRRRITDTVAVTDTLLGTPIGRLGNVSETGMLLIATTPLIEDALYQLRFEVRMTSSERVAIEVGAHLLWLTPAGTPGQSWAGLRFISVPDADQGRLRRWLDAPGATYA